MSWGRLKPFWKSKAWKKSAEKGTGLFSWGETDLAKGLDIYLPGLGTSLDASLDSLAENAGAFAGPKPKASLIDKRKAGVNIASFISNNPMVSLGIGAIVLYKVLK
jgi:hypothetical protein